LKVAHSNFLDCAKVIAGRANSPSVDLAHLASLSKSLINLLYRLPNQPQPFYDTVADIVFVPVQRNPIPDCSWEWPESFEKFSNMVLPHHKELIFTIKPILPEELVPQQALIAQLHFQQVEPSSVSDNILTVSKCWTQNVPKSLVTPLLKCYDFLQICMNQADIRAILEQLTLPNCIWNKDQLVQAKRLFFNCDDVPPYVYKGR
jgi:hypothetical protein